MSIEKIMEQTQVYASAWSLVGGRFDAGDGLERAEEEKAVLAREVTAVVRERDALLAAIKAAREALQFANESPGGPIRDTIRMMHTPETLFDFMDAAIAQAESPKGAE